MRKKCLAMKRNVPTNVAEAPELAKELHRSLDVSEGVEPSLKFSFILVGDPVCLCTWFEMAEMCILKLASVELITGRWHEELFAETNKNNA